MVNAVSGWVMQICHERAGERHFHQFKISTAITKGRRHARRHNKGITSSQHGWLLTLNFKPHGSGHDKMKQDVTIMTGMPGLASLPSGDLYIGDTIRGIKNAGVTMHEARNAPGMPVCLRLFVVDEALALEQPAWVCRAVR